MDEYKGLVLRPGWFIQRERAPGTYRLADYFIGSIGLDVVYYIRI